MKTLVLAVAFLAIILILAAIAKRFGLLDSQNARQAGEPARGPSPFKRAPSLLSNGELAFYRSLRAAVPAQTLIMAKVRLLDLINLPPGTPDRQSWNNRVQSKHVDFVLCDARDLRPLLVIELDDKSHAREDRRTRDGLVDDILSTAGLPLHREPAASQYAADRLRAVLAPKLANEHAPNQR